MMRYDLIGHTDIPGMIWVVRPLRSTTIIPGLSSGVF